jgi:hypothetical protein
MSGSVTISRKALAGIVAALGALGGFGVYTGVRADDKASDAQDDAAHAQQLGERGAKLAQTAKVEASAGYAATREKLDATAEVAADAATACVTRAELEAVHRRIDGLPLAGRRRRTGRRRVPAAVVPPEVNAPLPPTPAAAAAAAPTGGNP